MIKALEIHFGSPLAFNIASEAKRSKPRRPRGSLVILSASAPWNIGEYITKKSKRRVDRLGNLIDTPEDTAESFAWTPAAQLRLAATTLADSLQSTPDTLLERVATLASVLPGGHETVEKLKPADSIRLAAVVDEVPGRLIALKEVLPSQVDISKVVCAWPEVGLMSINEIEEGMQLLRDEFEDHVGELGIVRILETTPNMLSPELLKLTMQGAGHLMPRRQLADSLARYHDFYLQFMSLTAEPENNYDDVMEEDIEAWRASRNI